MSDSESDENEHNDNGFNPSGSQILLNDLFQKILNQQEETLLKNFQVLMEAEDIFLDNETKNDMMQFEIQTLISNLTQEFHKIMEERDDEEDNFEQCMICFDDERPYLKLNCECQMKIHKECYIEYLNENRKLNCPICRKTIFANYLDN